MFIQQLTNSLFLTMTVCVLPVSPVQSNISPILECAFVVTITEVNGINND